MREEMQEAGHPLSGFSLSLPMKAPPGLRGHPAHGKGIAYLKYRGLKRAKFVWKPIAKSL